MRFEKPSDRYVQHRQNTKHYQPAGNVLIYVVVLMLIFGVLGVVMVSLFTSTTASTVTRNDSRRARYLSESGVRYAASEMRKADFEEDIIINPLNTLIYTLPGAGSFDLNIFSPWFDSAANIDSPPDISLIVPLGDLPDDFTATALSDVWVVNYEYISGTGPDMTTMRDSVNNYSIAAGNLKVDINSDFVANEDERICLAVEPSQAQANLAEGDDLYVARDARLFFPGFNGAVNINRVDYAYERLVDDPDNNRVVLKNLTASQFPNTLPAFPLSVEADIGGTYSGDFVVLSPRNYMAIAEGTSDGVSWGNAYTLGSNVFDNSLIRPGARKPDITAEDLVTSLSEQETDTRFFETNLVDYELEIGGGTTEEFGSAFFDANMNIGGERDYCQQGACLFALGVRVFFLLDFNQQGDGITFTLLGKGFGALGPPNNSASSVGGDFQLSELMGYAGDSRLDADGTSFLATDPEDRGLDPPKIAVEFDTRTNEPNFNFCAGADLNPNTRNDPVPEGVDNKDVVQYVFWGREGLDLPCRSGSDNSSYDDNRHNADDWIAPTGNDVRSSPAVGADGTIYVGSNDNNVYAINPDGSPKWVFANPSGDVISSPAIGSDGSIYVGSNDNNVYAINPNGTLKWQFATGGDVKSSPAIASDGTIYIGSDDGFMYALDPTTGAQKPGWPFNAGAVFSLGRPAFGPDGTIYFSALNTIYARNPDGSEKWTTVLGLSPGADNDYMPGVDPDTGRVYTDVPGDALAALSPADGSEIWRVGVRSDIDSTPVVGSDGTIYFGTDDDAFALFAVTPGGDVKWEFNTGGQVDNTASLSPDGSEVYVVSMDGNLYAVNTADGEELWRFPIPVNPMDQIANSSPAVGADGTVYVGSTDNNLYAVGLPAEPRNIRDKSITSENLDSNVSVDSTTNWLNGAAAKGSWAVRLEVDRAPLPNAEGKFDYELRLWIRQCPDSNDIPCAEILGTFFQDTRIEYDYTAVEDLPMRQQFSLSGTEQDAFERFFFGFTGAAGTEALEATISQFQLSFIRPGDPVVSCDSGNWPVEPPLTDCTPGL